MARTVKPRRLLASAAIGAMLGMASASAQTGSFQGTAATAINASVAVSAGRTDVTVTGPRSIIAWTPADMDAAGSGAVDFQPAGTTATFKSDLTNFTVLNLIDAPGARAIALNGTVESQISNGAGGTFAGGNVWFYSRNGFLIGSTGRFDVGGLLLTANRPDGAYDSSAPDGFNGNFDTRHQLLTVEPGHSGAITIAAGAQINASSYIGLIAPRIVQGGAVRAQSSIGYIAGESVDLDLGNFTISVPVGSDGATIIHTGTTGGAASGSGGRAIAMVAVPKNDAVTMLLGGTIGYDAAQAVQVKPDGVLVLAGGGAALSAGGATEPTATSAPGTINIAGATFRTPLTATAAHIVVDASTSSSSFLDSAVLHGLLDSRVTIGAGQTVLGEDSLGLTSGGALTIDASGSGALTVDGALGLTATGLLSISHAAPAAAPTISGRSITIASGDVAAGVGSTLAAETSLAAQSQSGIALSGIKAGDTISMAAQGSISIDRAEVTSPVLITPGGAIDQTHGTIFLTAGDATRAADITIGTRATAAAGLSIAASNGVTIGAHALVGSDNATRLSAGNDIVVGAGATVYGGQAPALANSGLLALAVGSATPQPGTHSIIIDGTLEAFAAPLTLAADAIQADASIIRAGTFAIALATVPAAATVADTDGGQLRAECAAGSICLGAVTLPGPLAIGQTGTVPAALRIAGNVSASALAVRARDSITFGGASAPATLTIAGVAGVAVDNGAIGSAGVANLIAGGDITLAAARLTAPQLSAQAGGNLKFVVPQEIALRDAIAVEQIGTAAGSSIVPVALTGGFAIGGTLRAGTGGIDVSAAGIAINRLEMRSGTTLRLAATGGTDVTLTDASAGSIGSAGSAVIGGRNLSIGKLATTGTAALAGTGAVQAAELSAGGAVSAQGASVTIGSPGALSFAALQSLSGDVAVTTAGALTLPGATSAGALTLKSGGALTSGTLTAQGAIGLTAAGALQVSGNLATAAPITLVGDSISMTLGTPTEIASATARSGDLVLRGTGALGLASGSAGGKVDLAAGTLELGSINAGGAIATVASAGKLGFTRLAGASAQLGAAGPIEGGALVTSGAATLSSAGALSIADAAVGGAFTLTGTSVTVGASGALAVTSATATAGDIELTSSGGGITGTHLAATGAARLTATGAIVSPDISAAGGVTASGASIDLTAAGPLTIAGATATGAIVIATPSATLNGTIVGRTIAVSSQAIAIDPAARIGVAGTTTQVSFTNNGTQRSFVGGAGGAGYSLTADGLSRVQADAILVTLPAVGGTVANPDVVIGDVVLHGSTGTAAGTLANLTANGSFTLTTPGIAQVSGTLRLTDLGAGNSARIAAGPELDIVTPAGAVLLTDSAGAPAGKLELAADRIIIASQSAIADLAGLSGTDARSQRLGVNDGAVSDQGYVAADAITFRIATALDVQNSGSATPGARRGVSAGSGGVTIAATNAAAPELILNGRQAGTSDLAGALTYVASGGGSTLALASGSTVNGCTFGAILCGSIGGVELATLVLPAQDIVGVLSGTSSGGGASEDDEKKDSGNGRASPARVAPRPLITSSRPPATAVVPVIDEPVVGAPNDDLWIDPSADTNTGERPAGGVGQPQR